MLNRGDIFLRKIGLFSTFYSVISQKRELFLTTAVRTANPD
jgi:hypothetical protein